MYNALNSIDPWDQLTSVAQKDSDRAQKKKKPFTLRLSQRITEQIELHYSQFSMFKLAFVRFTSKFLKSWNTFAEFPLSDDFYSPTGCILAGRIR